MVTTVISNIIISMLYSRLKSFHMNCAVIYGEQNLKSDSFRAVFYCGLTKKRYLHVILCQCHTLSHRDHFSWLFFSFLVLLTKLGGKIICVWKLDFVYIASSILGRVNVYYCQS